MRGEGIVSPCKYKANSGEIQYANVSSVRYCTENQNALRHFKTVENARKLVCLYGKKNSLFFFLEAREPPSRILSRLLSQIGDLCLLDLC